MKYHIWAAELNEKDYVKLGELKPAADNNNCYFGSVKLWNEVTGFVKGQIRVQIGNMKYWIVSDDEMKYLEQNAEMELAL